MSPSPIDEAASLEERASFLAASTMSSPVNAPAAPSPPVFTSISDQYVLRFFLDSSFSSAKCWCTALSAAAAAGEFANGLTSVSFKPVLALMSVEHTPVILSRTLL